MKNSNTARTVRRSVVLSRERVDEALAATPSDLRHNFNRLVATALQEFVARQKRRTVEDAIARMAADPAIRAECELISREFAPAEVDGLRHG